MGIIARVKQAIGIKPVYSAFDLQSGRGRQRPKDVRSLVEEHNKSWVYICASRNAETVAGIPLKLYVHGGTANYYGRQTLSRPQKAYLQALTGKAADDVDEITEGHPLIDLLDRVNDELTRSELLEATVTYQELTGDAYWYLEPGPLGMPGAIYCLMSQYVRVVRDGEAKLVGYLYGKNEQTRVALKAEEVIHFRYPNPKDPDYGLSPLEATFGAATLLEAEEEYMRHTYDQGGMPQIGLVIKGRVTEDQRKELYAEWRDKFQSKRTGNNVIVLEGDITDLKTFGYPPKDVGVEFMQQFSREEIAGAFGVPLTMIQLNEASRAGAEAGNYQYMATTIMPKLRRIEQKINERLCPIYDPRLFVLFENPLPEDKEYRLKQIDTRIKNKVTTVNEERAIEGLEPVPWGDEPAMSPAPMMFALEPGSRHDHKHAKQVQSQMTANQQRFAEAVTDHFVRYARVVDERMADAS